MSDYREPQIMLYSNELQEKMKDVVREFIGLTPDLSGLIPLPAEYYAYPANDRKRTEEFVRTYTKEQLDWQWARMCGWLNDLLDLLIAEEEARRYISVEYTNARLRKEVFDLTIAPLAELRQKVAPFKAYLDQMRQSAVERENPI